MHDFEILELIDGSFDLSNQIYLSLFYVELHIKL